MPEGLWDDWRIWLKCVASRTPRNSFKIRRYLSFPSPEIWVSKIILGVRIGLGVHPALVDKVGVIGWCEFAILTEAEASRWDYILVSLLARWLIRIVVQRRSFHWGACWGLGHWLALVPRRYIVWMKVSLVLTRRCKVTRHSRSLIYLWSRWLERPPEEVLAMCRLAAQEYFGRRYPIPRVRDWGLGEVSLGEIDHVGAGHHIRHVTTALGGPFAVVCTVISAVWVHVHLLC